MKKEILDYIRHLSKTDEKNLSQKALKAAEEVGELAKVVLPYDNAFATNHRFVARTHILEEVADTILTVRSIACDLDFTDEEIEDMITHKTRYWADLQAREGRISYPIPYEIHVTVEYNKHSSLEYFKSVCQNAGVKPILLDLHLKEDAVFKDLMTSSTYMGNNRDAYTELKRISKHLELAGFKVVREKIETIPWHPAAPSDKHQNPTMPPACYFECHFNVLCTEEKLHALKALADEVGARRSSNVFKRYDDGSFTIMMTYRSYEGVYEEFQRRLGVIKEMLDNDGFEVEKEIIEFSIYDTKVSHDAAWITQGA